MDSVENDIIMQFANISYNFDFGIYGVYNVNLTSKCYGPKQLTRHINPKPCNLEDLTLEKIVPPYGPLLISYYRKRHLNSSAIWPGF